MILWAIIFIAVPDLNGEPRELGHSIGYYVIGPILIAFLLSYGSAYIVYYSRKKKDKAGTLTFPVVLTIILSLFALKYLNTSAKAFEDKKETRKTLLNSGDPKEFRSVLNKINSSDMSELGNMLETAEDKKIYDIIKQMNQNVKGEMKVFEKLWNELSSSDLLGSLASDDTFNHGVTLVEAYIKSAKILRNYFSKLPPGLEIQKAKSEVAKGMIMGLIEGSEDSVMTFQAHIDYGEAFLRFYDFFRNTKGEWSYENGELLFSNSDDLDEYNQVIELLVKKEDQLNAILEKKRLSLLD